MDEERAEAYRGGSGRPRGWRRRSRYPYVYCVLQRHYVLNECQNMRPTSPKPIQTSLSRSSILETGCCPGLILACTRKVGFCVICPCARLMYRCLLVLSHISDLGIRVILGERLDLSTVSPSALADVTKEHVLRTLAGREIHAGLVVRFASGSFRSRQILDTASALVHRSAAEHRAAP